MIIKAEHDKWLGFNHFECTVMEALGNTKLFFPNGTPIL